MNWLTASVHKDHLGTNHRVDGEAAVPASLRDASGRPDTQLARWLRALRDEFGPLEMARWGHHRVIRLSADVARILVNATVTGLPRGTSGPSPWLHVRATFHAVRTRWGSRPGESFWVVYPGSRPRRRSVARWGAAVGSAESLGGAVVVALGAAPKCPPPGSGWTLEEWSRRS